MKLTLFFKEVVTDMKTMTGHAQIKTGSLDYCLRLINKKAKHCRKIILEDK